jgi:SAM-dependent methyltransferase
VTGYLFAGQGSELERLQVQALAWEPAGQRLLDELGDGTGKRVLDIGCGALGWLRLLGQWVGGTGRCVGTDIDKNLLAAAAQTMADAGLSNCELVEDDLFESALPDSSFDLVHARFQVAPLGRFPEQLAAFRRLLRPGGVLVLEDPFDTAYWRAEPPAPAAERIMSLVDRVVSGRGGQPGAGRYEAGWLAAAGLQPRTRAESLTLPPGHPYQRLPLQFAAAMRSPLSDAIGEGELDALLASTETELAHPDRWVLTFALVQTWTVVGS